MHELRFEFVVLVDLRFLSSVREMTTRLKQIQNIVEVVQTIGNPDGFAVLLLATEGPDFDHAHTQLKRVASFKLVY